MEIKYPDIIVQLELAGEGGNAFVILGKIMGAMRKAKVSKKEIDVFQKEAMSGDYDNLLATCMKWVNVT